MPNYGILQNGMKWIIKEVPCSNVTSVQILTSAGSRVEKDGKRGIAHLIEHLMFDGTEKSNQLELTKQIYDYGGEMNAFTTNDLVGYHCKMLSEHTEKMLSFFSEILYYSTFKDEDIEKEKKVVLQELTSKLNNPVGMTNMIILPSVAWKNTPVCHPVGGYEDQINSITRQDIIDFINTYYRPDQMVISIAGNLPDGVDGTEAMLDEYFGNVKVDKNKVPKIPYAKQIYQNEPFTKTMTLNTQEAIIMMAFPYMTDKIDKYVDIISLTLIGTMSSRLFIKLRTENGLIYSISPIHNRLKDVSMYGFVFSTKNNTESIEKCVELVLQELITLREEGITEEECERAKENLKSQMIMGLEDTLGLASFYAEKMLYHKKGEKISTFEDSINEIDNIKCKGIKDACKELFDPIKMNLIVIN